MNSVCLLILTRRNAPVLYRHVAATLHLRRSVRLADFARERNRLACWCAASPVAQRAQIDAHPQRYFYPPYVGHRGWLGIYLDVPVDWDEVAELVREAYRLVAPRQALAELDALDRSLP
jgi:hypothetical protein